MEGEEAGAAPGGNVLDKRTPSMAAEMKAFLDDSDEEGGGGAALGVALGLGNGASMPGAADSAAGSAPASTTDLGIEIVSVSPFIMKWFFLAGGSCCRFLPTEIKCSARRARQNMTLQG